MFLFRHSLIVPTKSVLFQLNDIESVVVNHHRSINTDRLKREKYIYPISTKSDSDPIRIRFESEVSDFSFSGPNRIRFESEFSDFGFADPTRTRLESEISDFAFSGPIRIRFESVMSDSDSDLSPRCRSTFRWK